ncbi:MAG: heavy metal translocating P-type ATPase [Thermoanaerobaculia bacterium]
MNRWLVGLTLTGLLAGTAFWLGGAQTVASACWAVTTAVMLAVLSISVARDLARGKPGVDLIALLAMASALVFHQYAAGAIIALMLSGGLALEAFADARARRELDALLEHAPRVVHRYENEVLTSPDIEAVHPGDLLLVKSGEIVPVDGLVVGGPAVLDESTLTGESLPVTRADGQPVRSGSVNAGGPFDLRAVATADQSTYAGIVRLVQGAKDSKAPLVRLADRWALLFLPLTLGLAGFAWWWSGDPIRALAVLVVATPCPLILAAPVAIVAGLSRCAARGIVVKGGAVLEALGGATILLLDKTGTLTTGQPALRDVRVYGTRSADEILRLAASLDQVSPHVFAAPLVGAARDKGLVLAFPTGVTEIPGEGIAGEVEGVRVALGKLSWVGRDRSLTSAMRQVRRSTALEGTSSVWVAIGEEIVATLILHDPIRPDARTTIRALRRSGIRRVVMITGDHPEVAETVGFGVGADLVLAERSPAEKVDAVLNESERGSTIMVGDGLNDAPALAAATVGVAMGARGATASAQAADVVLTVDHLGRLAEAMAIAQRSRSIAFQSVSVGMALSLAAMLIAAAGRLPPLAGALLQEAIDVAVILNALRALSAGRRPRAAPAGSRDLGERFRAEHADLLPRVETLRSVADQLDTLSPADLRVALEDLRSFLDHDLIPHERQEDATVYPVVARLLGGEDPTGTMSRAHMEIAHQVRLFGRLVDELPAGPLSPEDKTDLRRILYGSHAVLRLHFAQEEEQYLPLLGLAGEAVRLPRSRRSRKATRGATRNG